MKHVPNEPKKISFTNGTIQNNDKYNRYFRNAFKMACLRNKK